MYDQIHQEQIVAGEMTQNIVENPAVQEQVIVQEIPQVSIVERIQEQIVEPIEVLPHERVTQRTFNQIVHVPVPQVQEQSVTGLVNPKFSTSAVEAPQVVNSFPLLEDVAAREYNQVHQEHIVATPQAQVIVQEIPESPVDEWIQEQILETGVNRDTTGLVFQEFPEVSVVERTQEQIVETMEVIAQERFQQCPLCG